MTDKLVKLTKSKPYKRNIPFCIKILSLPLIGALFSSSQNAKKGIYFVVFAFFISFHFIVALSNPLFYLHFHLCKSYISLQFFKTIFSIPRYFHYFMLQFFSSILHASSKWSEKKKMEKKTANVNSSIFIQSKSVAWNMFAAMPTTPTTITLDKPQCKTNTENTHTHTNVFYSTACIIWKCDVSYFVEFLLF